LVAVALLLAAGGLCSPTRAALIEPPKTGLTLDLPDEWIEEDRWTPVVSEDALTSGDCVFQAIYRKVLEPAGGPGGPSAPDPATVILRCAKGPRPFATTLAELSRLRGDFERQLKQSGDPAKVEKVRKRIVAGGERAIEVAASGEREGRRYRQRVVNFTGARYSFVLSFQAFEDNWPRWEQDWEDILGAMRIEDPYPWPVNPISGPVLGTAALGAIVAGLIARAVGSVRARSKRA
jgi:hypothetical protein